MEKHTKKMVAPIVISGFLLIYYLFFFFVIFSMPELSGGLKLLFGILPLALSGVVIFVLNERIQEIRSGEEDDLSQY